MAGVYLHIPYCKQACYYCDFHFSTRRDSQQDMVDAMVKEIRHQKSFFGSNKPVKTIYFGGGTPSLLTTSELQKLLNTLHETFDCSEVLEITLEANPDDLSLENLAGWKQAGVNRLSIGIQSFNDAALKFCNRAHNTDEARSAIKKAQAAGFEKFSIDLIYGIPVNTMDDWIQDVSYALETRVDHISAYCLTIEPKTVFGKWSAQGSLPPIDQDLAADQYDYLVSTLAEAGFEHYEVSNFARNGAYAQHNTNYWFYEPYLGIGPGAHGFDGSCRFSNPANNSAYLKSWQNDKPAFTIERLSREDQIAEYLLTSLRTQWGCDISKLKTDYNYDLLSLFGDLVSQWVATGLAVMHEQSLILTDKGRLMADHLTLQLVP